MMSETLRAALTLFFAMVTCAVGQQSNVPVVSPNSGTGLIRLPAEGSPLFNPSQKRALSYRGRGLVIRLINGKKNLAVEITNGARPAETVQLPSEIVQVNEIFAGPNGKAVVVGMVNGSVFEVVILGNSPPAVADTFLAYAPAVSPDGRFIAFAKFYPAHFTEGTGDHYLLYDVLKDAPGNRAAGIPASDRTNVGQPIYPRIPNHDGDNTGLSRAEHHMISQSFFWQSDSTRYAFADDRDGEWNAFVVAVAKGNPEARSVTISRADFCAPMHKDTCQATLAAAELGSDEVLLDFRGTGADSSVVEFARYDYKDLHAAQ